MTDTTLNNDNGLALSQLLDDARQAVTDVDDDVRAALADADQHPIDAENARELLHRVIAALKRSSDPAAENTAAGLERDFEECVAVIASGSGNRPQAAGDQGGSHDGTASAAGVSGTDTPSSRRLELHTRDDIDPRPVHPTPVFDQQEIPMRGGFVRVTDLLLRDDNERLEVHLAQFRQINNRQPSPDELLSLMMSTTPLPGLEGDDQFKIKDLGRSIANNGVRKPPVIDLDGTLLDGNRRVAACLWVLGDTDFTTEQRERAEWVFVWQLTEYSNSDHRHRVVVSLNFEDDLKEDWPEYVKARKVFDAWQEMLSLESRVPGTTRTGELKKELSKRFALGPRADIVNRYIKMVQEADRFEEHQVEDRGNDSYEVKHRASEYFQYFDELTKGKNDGVAAVLGADDILRGLVYDLLFQQKVISFSQVRDLRHVANDDQAIDGLREARDKRDQDVGREQLKNVLAKARALHAERRNTDPNPRIADFVEWLEALPVSSFRDAVKTENLEKLLLALKLARGAAGEVLGEERVNELLAD
jgi:hypothetical protein